MLGFGTLVPFSLFVCVSQDFGRYIWKWNAIETGKSLILCHSMPDLHAYNYMHTFRPHVNYFIIDILNLICHRISTSFEKWRKRFTNTKEKPDKICNWGSHNNRGSRALILCTVEYKISWCNFAEVIKAARARTFFIRSDQSEYQFAFGIIMRK